MAKNSVLKLLLLGVFLLSGCGPKELNYSEAAGRFKVGLTTKEIENIYGKPQTEMQLTNMLVWSYYPARKIDKSRGGEYEGFAIDFQDGKSVKISRSFTTVK